MLDHSASEFTEPSLSRVFRAVPNAGCRELADAELEQALVGHVAAGRAAWPDIALDPDEYVRYLGARVCGSQLPPLGLAEDLWLACACASGVSEAFAAFHTQYSDWMTRVLIRRGASPDVLSDLAQTVFEKLLVGKNDAPPQIADYSGHGPLKAWVAAVAVTTLLMQRRATERRRETLEPDPIVAEVVLSGGPELDYLKRRYREPVEAAIVFALSELSDRERVLLRLHLCERMSIDKLAAMYRVNRATTARWLGKARSQLLAETRAELRRKLDVDDRECDSLLHLVRSQLNVSVVRHLQP